jgi:hypothetical protein
MSIVKADVEKALGNLIAERTRWLEQATSSKAEWKSALSRLSPVLRLLPKSASFSMYLEEGCITIRDVENMRDIEPILESLEEVAGGRFNKSEDLADSEFGMRTFRMEGFPLRVNAVIKEGSNCKRVVVGETIVPKYELRCEEPE